MSQPTPTNIEVSFPDGEFIVSKTDLKGRIIYGNRLFTQMSGYTEAELLGAPHSVLRHPDMPKAVFKLLWDRISSGDEIFAFVKNMTKDGGHYWVKAHITPSFGENNKITSYHSVRRKPKKEAIQTLEPIYRQMLSIEKNSGMGASEEYLNDLLSAKGVSYDELVFPL